MVLAGINKLFNGFEILCLRDYYAPFYLFPFLVLSSSLSYSRPLFLGIVLIVAGESVVGIFEYFSGIRSFVLDLGELSEITDYSLLYNSRVYGLSGNSSILGYKILIAFLIIDYCKLKPWQEWSLRGLLLIGLLLSFSRMAVIVLLIYWVLRLIVLNKKLLSAHSLKSAAIQYFIVVVLM